MSYSGFLMEYRKNSLPAVSWTRSMILPGKSTYAQHKGRQDCKIEIISHSNREAWSLTDQRSYSTRLYITLRLPFGIAPNHRCSRSCASCVPRLSPQRLSIDLSSPNRPRQSLRYPDNGGSHTRVAVKDNGQHGRSCSRATCLGKASTKVAGGLAL